MTIKEFSNVVASKINELLSEGKGAEAIQTSKNNGVELDAIIIKENQSGVSPTIYTEEFFEKYQNEEITIEGAASEILRIYEANKNPEMEVSIDDMIHWETIKNQICYKVINKTLNEKLLEDVPHIDYMDLAIIYFINFGKYATAIVHNQHMKSWDVNLSELHQVASENTPRLYPIKVQNINEIIAEMTGESIEELNDDNSLEMYVMTNEEKIFGAATILYEGALKDFAESSQKSFYIIPSSIHEVLLVPDDGKNSSHELDEMIKKVNIEDVDTQEWLSDHAYYYDLSKGFRIRK